MSNAVTLRHASSGVEGLDDIMRGGFPRGRIYLLKGTPGTGKTTLALQFLLAGAAAGERSLYITLSETKEEVTGVALSHGWSLDNVSVFELNPPSGASDEESATYTMFHPAEVELGRTMETLLAEVKRVEPRRVVFDSLSEVRLLAQSPLRYRRQVLELKRHFAGSDCTVLLLDDHGGDSDTQLESLAHGVVALERRAPVYGGARRRLEVVKLRGVKYRDGFHDFTIEHGGLAVYPRLVAAEHPPDFIRSGLASGVPALDALLAGGLERGTSTLVLGPAGAGKSALATQYALSAAEAGELATIYTFDESVATFFARAESLGMPVRAHADAGRIRVHQVDPAEMAPGQFGHAVREAVDKHHARVVVIDSLTGYLNAMPEERFLLNQLHELLSFLGQRGVVTLLVATQHGLIGEAVVSPIDVSYLADAVILLRYFEAVGRVRNAISILKKRTGAHERTLREYALTKNGIEIGSPLTEFRGVLTGVPVTPMGMDIGSSRGGPI